MYTVNIRQVIWSDKKWNGGKGQKAVGIADRDLIQDDDNWIGVTIGNTAKDGKKYFPHPFKILKTQVINFGIDIKKGVKLYIVPLTAMREDQPNAAK